MDFSGYHQRKQKHKTRKVVLFFITAILLIVCSYLLGNSIKPAERSTLAATTAITVIPSPSPTPANIPAPDNEQLAAAVNSALAGSKGRYGVVIKNFKSGEYYFSGEYESFQPASLYKLWVMAVVYKKIESGELRRDYVLSQRIETLNKKFALASESAELQTGVITRPVADLLNRMITISDNYSALLLTEKVRLSSVAEYLKISGFNQSNISTKGEDPTTTPFDIALFLEKLYTGQMDNPQNTKEMLDLLKGQRLNNKLPKYLPAGITIAHKTGELFSYSHDAGIVYSPEGDYLIVVLSDSNNPEAAEERIAAISRNVYRYFTNKTP